MIGNSGRVGQASDCSRDWCCFAKDAWKFGPRSFQDFQLVIGNLEILTLESWISTNLPGIWRNLNRWRVLRTPLRCLAEFPGKSGKTQCTRTFKQIKILHECEGFCFVLFCFSTAEELNPWKLLKKRGLVFSSINLFPKGKRSSYRCNPALLRASRLSWCSSVQASIFPFKDNDVLEALVFLHRENHTQPGRGKEPCCQVQYCLPQEAMTLGHFEKSAWGQDRRALLFSKIVGHKQQK